MRFIAGTLSFGRCISHVGRILNDILNGLPRHGAGLTHPRAALPSGAPPSTRCSFRSVLGALSALYCGAKSERALHNLRCSLVAFPPQACLRCWMSARPKVNIISCVIHSRIELIIASFLFIGAGAGAEPSADVEWLGKFLLDAIW
jgi:hypothetical protein